jgi:hypothetical protein
MMFFTNEIQDRIISRHQSCSRSDSHTSTRQATRSAEGCTLPTTEMLELQTKRSSHIDPGRLTRYAESCTLPTEMSKL